MRDHRLLNIKAPSGKAGAFFCLIFAITGCGALVSALDLEREETIPRIVGGPCEYNEYRGKATIVSICKKERDKSRGGPSYENFEVKFSFSPEEEIKESFAKVEGREYTLMLANSWYPGPKFLEKYGIKVGKTLSARTMTR